MRATGVIVRFLSLLDVAIILLGIFLLAIAQAQIRAPKKKVSAAGEAVRQAVANRFIYLYAGTQGEENGKAYLLGPDGRRLREVRTNVPDDLQQILKETTTRNDSGNRVVLLLVSPLGFDTMWPPSRLAQMEKTWGVTVVPLYNVKLDAIR